jgi:murein DD-endopeptidase MepM/ murein hydrolase activator NlpD
MTQPLNVVRISRRSLATGLALAGAVGMNTGLSAQQRKAPWTLPIGWPDRVPGDGFWIRHGYATENTWYNPGWWHTGEDWYALEGETAGALVYAIASGAVVFVGSEYPGRVVIVEHPGGLYSMYGHLDYAVPVSEGDAVEAGQVLGTILLRTDGNAPSHLHFEFRDFLYADRVNGQFPENGVGCGYMCAPGPGYWPQGSPDHPTDLGWRNPSHVIAANWRTIATEDGLVAVPAGTAREAVAIRDEPGEDGLEIERLGPASIGRVPILAVDTGEPDSREATASAYHLWFQIALSDGAAGWVRALEATPDDTGSDGSPSSLRWRFLVAGAEE